jgi:hypothetical protein
MQGNLSHAAAKRGNLDGALAHGLAIRRLAARAGRVVEVRTGLQISYVHLWRGEVLLRVGRSSSTQRRLQRSMIGACRS